MNSGQRLFFIVRGQPRTLLLIVGLFLAVPAVHGPVLAAQSGLQSTGQPDTLPLSLPGTAFTYEHPAYGAMHVRLAESGGADIVFKRT